jgi:hypothetical protein
VFKEFLERAAAVGTEYFLDVDCRREKSKPPDHGATLIEQGYDWKSNHWIGRGPK